MPKAPRTCKEPAPSAEEPIKPKRGRPPKTVPEEQDEEKEPPTKKKHVNSPATKARYSRKSCAYKKKYAQLIGRGVPEEDARKQARKARCHAVDSSCEICLMAHMISLSLPGICGSGLKSWATSAQ